MPALCSMLSGTYYAQNHASIIGGSLSMTQNSIQVFWWPFKLMYHYTTIYDHYHLFLLYSTVIISHHFIIYKQLLGYSTSCNAGKAPSALVLSHYADKKLAGITNMIWSKRNLPMSLWNDSPFSWPLTNFNQLCEDLSTEFCSKSFLHQ